MDVVTTTSTKQEQNLDKLRNIGIVAHIDAGKTTTTERILFYTGIIHEPGEVDEGDTQMDWMPQERERGITITAAATLFQWRGHQINLIDTPGHVDFTAEVERSLRVLDGAIIIFSGVDMVESQTEKVWRQADRYNIPRLAYINKLDRPGAQYERTIEMMADKLGTTPLPLQLPAGVGEELLGMIDLLKMKLIVWDQETKGIKYSLVEIPERFLEPAKRFREQLIETLAEVDDHIMESYLEGKDLGLEELKGAIRRACLSKGCVPVLGGSSLKNIGVQPLLDAVVDYLPSPLDRGRIIGLPLNGVSSEQLIRQPSPEEPLAALAFKVAVDEYTGRLVYVRVYSGKLEQGSYVLNATTGRRERVARIFQMHANKRREIEGLSAGQIGALVGPKELSTGDTICDPDHPILLEKIEFPEPVVFAAVEPKSDSEEGRLTEALAKLVQEDPTLQMKTDPETNQLLIAGMGELHLEIIFDRLRREFNVQARLGRPQVAYKETLLEPVDVEEKFIRQTGGRGQYGHVCIRFEPLPRGGGFEFVDATKGGVIPKEFIPAVREGILEAMGSGPLAGYPVTDLKATLYYGSYHEVDSSEIAFKTAAARALCTAFHRARTELLEPIMEGEIITPTEYIGEIISDLHTRRGEIKGFDVHGNTQVIRVLIPLAETFGYATVLRSLSQGRATYQLKFSHYEIVPERIKEAILGVK